MEKLIAHTKNRIKYSTLEQRRPNLAMRDQISQDEEAGGPELPQETSSKDWATHHENNAHPPPTSRVEVVQQAMGKQGRLFVWIGLALMLII